MTQAAPTKTVQDYLREFQRNRLIAQGMSPEAAEAELNKRAQPASGKGGKQGGGMSTGAALGTTVATTAAAAWAKQKMIEAGRNALASKTGAVATPKIVGAEIKVAGANPDGSVTLDNGATVTGNTVTTPDGVTVDTAKGTAVKADGTSVGDVTPYLQAAGAALLAYQAYKSYKQGDKVGAGAYGAGAATTGAAAAGSTTAATAVPYVAAALAAYQAGKNYQSASKAADGGNFTEEEVTSVYSPYRSTIDKYKNKIADHLGPLSQPFKNYIGGMEKIADYGPVGLIAKAVLGSSKDDAQIFRDRYRKSLQKAGVIDDKFQYKGADGSSFDMGLDGGARLKNVGANIDGEMDRGAYDVDFSNPLAGKTVGYLNPLTAITLGGPNNDRANKLHSDATGMFTNAALANAKSEDDVRREAIAMYLKNGLDSREKAIGALDAIKDKVGDKYGAYAHGINSLYSDPKLAGYIASNIPNAKGPAPITGSLGAVTGAASGITPLAPQVRSKTLSPGIGKDGKRIKYGK